MISGELIPQQGKISCCGELVICPQHFASTAETTVAEVLGADAKLAALEQVAAGTADEADYELLAEDWDIESRIEAVFAELDLVTISPKNLYQTLSGGQQTKLLLARCLLSKADVTLLDEPTNNLDQGGRELLQGWLEKSTNCVIVISHDRDLLNQTDHIIELTTKGINCYGGNYNFYQQQKAVELAAAQHVIQAQKELLESAKRQVQLRQERHQRNEAKGRRGKQAQIKAKGSYDKLAFNSQKGRSEKTNRRIRLQAERKLDEVGARLQSAKAKIENKTTISADLMATQVPQTKQLITVSSLTFAYKGQKELFEGFNFNLVGSERVALLGDNGSGKSTLLKLLLGELVPLSGKVHLGTELWCYLDQKAAFLQDDLTLVENYQILNPGVSLKDSYFALASMNFRAGDARKLVRHLSGGERVRAGLAISLLASKPPQLIFLDEPTNHLDINSLEAVEALLISYQGALLVVSHDQAFLQRIGVERRVELEN